ncbi:Type IV fimbrial assembly protein PilC [Thioalkalivibrio nitratireducens DSM 14787]|uniref:Type IV fimbrial assembly protein PilC n=1 Tax=Thioalkalivibrio nitratireducens (strain DSM 14787 / UNIQEM 213 / ALEN2) TaxID=1255043 RepID=L0DZ39_THIND|nr:type II secretion system F family protein [Thioalkalivibrio nitratireducens]AGA34230.1 Type IV fimbrial assembly protein PilC [Thioalkalivibrio nitratireducens DSM 14787]
MAETETIYIWEGLNKKGTRVKGETPADSEMLARAELRRNGINVLKIRKKPKSLFSTKKRIKPVDIAYFLRQMTTMLSSGVPLVQAFDIVGRGHENPTMATLIMDLKSSVEGGETFAAALAKHPRHFDDLVINLVEAGEQSGTLETLLDKVATYKEKTESLKAKIKKAMFYPAAVIVVAIVVTAILLIFVVPQFEALFVGFGADLPAFTRMVVNLSELVQAWWWAILAAMIALGLVFIQLRRRSPRFSRFVDLAVLRIPAIGPILRKAAVARFARTLSTMFAAGVPLVEALRSVAGATGNALYAEATERMREETAAGAQLQWSMRNTNVFPNMVVQMVAIGEESGSLDSMLAKVADFYEEEVDNAVDSLSSLLEPLIMVVLGVLIGGLVIAMYLPIFMLGQVI